jgi:hypothetical protein
VKVKLDQDTELPWTSLMHESCITEEPGHVEKESSESLGDYKAFRAFLSHEPPSSSA